jgi:hypothetical protein
MLFTGILLALGLATARSVPGQLSKFLGIPFAYPPCVQVRRYSEVSNIDIGIAVRVISGFACLCLSDHTAKMTANL